MMVILLMKRVKEEIGLLTDWFTDDLFHSTDDIIIKANFSRVFCDVERFVNDEFEVMSKKGMGVLYTHTDSGKSMREVSEHLRERILEDYYWPHHERLSNAVKGSLEVFDKALIFDCHSFSDKPFQRDLNKKVPRPDFNIGTDGFHTPKELIKIASDFFQKRGYTVGIDWPYSGTMVPMDYYQKDNRVVSLMLEVNRKLYLKNVSSKIEKDKHYPIMKEIFQEFVQFIKTHI